MFDISRQTKQLHAFCLVVRDWSLAKKATAMANKINIGQEIHQELLKQGRTVAWLSRQLGTSRMACYRIFDGYSIDSDLLRRISLLLGRDFFNLYSQSITEEIGEQS